jgi:hypothetical protein
MRFKEPLRSQRYQFLGNALIYPSVFVTAETCFNKPLRSNARLFRFHHSGFQAPCHIIIIIIINIIIVVVVVVVVVTTTISIFLSLQVS